MPSTTATAAEIKKFVVLQWVITLVFLGVIFWMFDGTDGDYPPIWLIVLHMLTIVVAAVLAERVWLRGPVLDPSLPPAAVRQAALDAFAAQTIRRFVITEIPLLFAVLVSFSGSYGGWPVLITGIPGLALLVWETWPHLRATSMAEAIFDSDGADSALVETFARS